MKLDKGAFDELSSVKMTQRIKLELEELARRKGINEESIIADLIHNEYVKLIN